MHAGEQAVLVHAEVSSNEEEAALGVSGGRDGQHARLRHPQPAAAGLAQHLLQVLGIRAIHRPAVQCCCVHIVGRRAAVDVVGGDEAVHHHGARVAVVGHLDRVAGALKVLNGACTRL